MSYAENAGSTFCLLPRYGGNDYGFSKCYWAVLSPIVAHAIFDLDKSESY